MKVEDRLGIALVEALFKTQTHAHVSAKHMWGAFTEEERERYRSVAMHVVAAYNEIIMERRPADCVVVETTRDNSRAGREPRSRTTRWEA